MADTTVDIPGMGPVKKRWLWVAGGIGAAVVAWSYWRARSAPVVVEEGIDGHVGVGDDGTGNVPGKTGDSSGNFTDPDTIDTTAEWVQHVTPLLLAAGWEPQFIALTLGKWIGGELLTTQEKQLVQAALAQAGTPPGGPYPIKTAPVTNPPDPDPDPPIRRIPPIRNPEGIWADEPRGLPQPRTNLIRIR